ncbi:MAG: DUF1893 domain-containing protein [Dehalococcoidales bacterium]|nr:DUF1893 domain-containing protein [Dehalococcoidales bacterium]
MSLPLFNEFLASNDRLRVYCGDRLIFMSDRDDLSGLVEYIERFSLGEVGIVVLDRVVGNAAALLLKQMSCSEVYSPLASQLAVETLRRFGIDYHFTEVVPYIYSRTGQGMCPLERLSLDKSPQGFYELCCSLDLANGG